MLLGKLLKEIDSTPKVYGWTTMGPLQLVKSDFKEKLRAFFQDDLTQETGMKLNEEGVAIPDN